MSRLDDAIANFEDENSDLTLGERISCLREALMYTTFKKLQAAQEGGNKIAADEAIKEEAKQAEIMKWFRELEKLYTSQVRMNKLTGKKEDPMDKDFLKRVKELKGSMSDIVRDLKPSNN